jgi:acetyltransferase
MVASATADNYRRAIAVLVRDPAVDMVLVIFVPPITHEPVAVARAVFEAAKHARQPVVGCFMSRDEVLRAIASEAQQDWVPVYLYPESAVRALRALDERRQILERASGKVRRFPRRPRGGERSVEAGLARFGLEARARQGLRPSDGCGRARAHRRAKRSRSRSGSAIRWR